jgi:hypothetical protein
MKVKELIAKLQQHDLELEVAVYDAETQEAYTKDVFVRPCEVNFGPYSKTYVVLYQLLMARDFSFEFDPLPPLPKA